MKTITRHYLLIFILIFFPCSVLMSSVEGSKLKTIQNRETVRFRRAFNRNGLYSFSNNSSTFMTKEKSFSSSTSNADLISVSTERTTLPYTEETNRQQHKTDYFTDPSTRYDNFSASTRYSPLPLLQSEKNGSSRTFKKTARGNYLEPPKIPELMRDIKERLESEQGTHFLNSLQSDFQRKTVLTQLYNCPFVPLCKFSLSLNYKTYAFQHQPMCCDACSCKKKECIAGGTCCPDVDWFFEKPRVMSRGVEEMCQPTGVRPRKNTGIHLKTITGCPLYTDPELFRKCVKDYNKPSIDVQFEDIVMVTDPSTKEIYRNKHCALCNSVNVSNLIYWTAQLLCEYEPREKNTTAFETLTAIFNDKLKCDIEFLNQGLLDMSYVSCSYAISTCNVTGSWIKYDQVTETACAMYGSYVYKDRYTVFRNIFCALCNGYYLPLENVCTFRRGGSYYPYTFSALLLLNEGVEKVEEHSDDKRKMICGTGKMLDKVKEKCRVAKCSSGRILEDRKCHIIDETIRLLTLNVKLRLLAPEGLLLTDAYRIVPEIKTTLIELVEDMFNPTNTYICGLQVILTSNIKTELLAGSTGSNATVYKSFPRDDVKLSNTETFVKETEIQYYDIRLQITAGLSLEKIARFMKQINGSKISLRGDIVEKSKCTEKVRYVSTCPMTLSQEPAVNSDIIFHINLVHGFHSENFDLIAKTSYYRLTYNGHKGQEVVGINEVLSFLSFFNDNTGMIQFPYLRWNDELALCKSFKSFDLSSFLECPMFILPWSEISWTETAYGIEIPRSSIRLDFSEFTVDRAEDFSTQLLICVDTYEKKFASIHTRKIKIVEPEVIAKFYISIIFVSASIVCLSISLLTFCLLKQLRTTPGKNNMALIVSLLFAQLLHVLGNAGWFDSNSAICKTIGLLTHFFWLLSVFWMNACTFHMCRVLLRTRNISNIPDTRKHIFYHSYCVALAILFVSINATVSMIKSGNSDIGYGKVLYYISTQSMIEVTFGVPAALVITSNLGMFLAIVIKVRKTQAIQKSVNSERNYVLVFAKLSTVTGVTWIFGFVYMWSKIEAFSFLFIIFNASQGVFIMLAFVMNKRTIGLYKNRFGDQKSSTSNENRNT